jgi:hypothetical protein
MRFARRACIMVAIQVSSYVSSMKIAVKQLNVRLFSFVRPLEELHPLSINRHRPF